MSAMVEKVARAICALHYQDPSELTNAYPDGPMYPVWKDFESSARAAIEAMKMTSLAMDVAGAMYLRENHTDASGCFVSMVETALKEEGQ